MTEAAPDTIPPASFGVGEALSMLATQKPVLERIVAGESLPSMLDALVSMIEGVSRDGVLGSVLLLDDDGVHLRHGAAPSLPAFYNEAIDGVEIGPSVGSCGTAAYRREQVIVEDIATDPLWDDFRDVALRAGLRACWSTPIQAADGRVLGTFAMYYPEARRPNDVDLGLIDVLVRIAAVAIERRRADEDRERALANERRARTELKFILDVTTRVASALDFAATLERLAELAVPALADVCLIDVVEGDGMRRAAVAGDGAERLAAFPPSLDGGHPAARVVATGEVEYAADVSDDLLRRLARDPDHLQAAHDLGFESYICVPLAARDTVFGTLTLVSTGSGRHYGDDDVTLARDLATRAALVIDNTRLHQATREAEQRLEMVVRAGSLLTSSLDLDDVVARLCDLLVPDVGDVCEVHVRTVDRVLHRAGASLLGASVLTVAGDLPSAVAEVVRTGSSVQVGPLSPADVGTVLSPSLAPDGLRAATVVPLVARGEAVGTIAVGVSESGSERSDLEVLPVLAGRAALAIDNARLYAAERSVAETLQRSLLPQRLPRVEGLEIAARYRPGGPGVDVGGDWYDVLPFPDGRVGLVIGDVMGRGVVAASVMGQLRNALRGFALQGLGPGEALELLDRLLQTDDDCPLATLFLGVIEPASGAFVFGNAGHLPPLVVAPDGSLTWVETPPQPPLGAAAGGRYHESSMVVGPGSTLILYTDGLVERRNQSLDVSLEALGHAAEVAVAASLRADALCSSLVEWFADSAREPDDTAVLAARLTA
ncbi:MAG TPA: SpoIIE family protein phosphatase [Acidimicrobiales bacterium]|nr:SpoIIE family protein phosphatase [Acidimicrobiales bacterium]